MPRSLIDCDNLIQARAARLVRLVLAGRKGIPNSEKRAQHHRRTDRAFDLLIAAVEERDRALVEHNERMAKWRARHERSRRRR